MSSNPGQETRKVGAFDIRYVIGALIGAYGVILTLLGVFNATEAELARGDGLNINLWAGLGMLAVGVVFAVWAKWRPLVLPPPKKDPEMPDDD